MKQTRRWSSVLFNLILFMGLVVIWIAFAPAKIGGQASYVMVNGISMEPNYHTGDLVIVRKAGTYQVGDVITYRDAEMGAYVIHRIIGIEQGQFIIKGDNNSWVDAYQPTPDEIVGKQWVYAPKAGRAMQWLRKPINLTLTILLLGGVFMSSMITKPSKGKKKKNNPSVNLGGMLEGTLYLLGFLFLGFLGLSIFAFTRPATRTADTIPYQQEGNYSYTATGTPGVYDTEMVRSGEPVFPRLACFLNVGLTYNLAGNQLQNVSGSQQMFARIMDQPSGWQRTIPLLPPTAFSGGSFSSMAALDLCQLETLVNLVEKETGFHTNTYTVEIVTNITFNAIASGQAISGAFDPVLAFKYDKVHLYLANTNDVNPMHITKEDHAGSANVEANTVPLLGWEPTVGFVRAFALLGLGISLSGLVIMGLSVFNIAQQNEHALIRLRYGSILVDIYEKYLEPNSTFIDVTSMDDLAKLAERQGTMILHMTVNFLHYYLVVLDDGITYRYVVSTGKKGISESAPESNEIPKTITNELRAAEPVPFKSQKHWMTVNRENSGRSKPIHNEILEPDVHRPKNKIVQQDWVVAEDPPQYIIRKGEIEFVMQPETEMLKRVRL
jgi:signal peptidase I